ncbi:MAG: RusA family crossover junction endodeoxyribonuclease [Phycisphaerales bacterium]
MLQFAVACIPRGQPRVRARVIPGQRFAHVYTPGRADGFKAAIALAARKAGLPQQAWRGPVCVAIDAFFPRPLKRDSGMVPTVVAHTGKPDVDNIEKAVLDTLTRVGLWEDDAQVYSLSTRKWYVARGAQPGISIAARLDPDGTGGVATNQGPGGDMGVGGSDSCHAAPGTACGPIVRAPAGFEKAPGWDVGHGASGGAARASEALNLLADALEDLAAARKVWRSDPSDPSAIRACEKAEDCIARIAMEHPGLPGFLRGGSPW